MELDHIGDIPVSAQRKSSGSDRDSPGRIKEPGGNPPRAASGISRIQTVAAPMATTGKVYSDALRAGEGRILAGGVPRSVGFFDEDESGALDYGSARADERDVDVLDLAFPGTARRLQRAFDDVPETMDAPRAQAPTEGVQRELTVELHASVLDEIQRFALLAEPVGLEAVDDRGGEAVVDLRHVDVFRGEARSLPGEARRAAAALHVAAQAPDASRHLERQPLTVARDVRGARPQIARAVGGG